MATRTKEDNQLLASLQSVLSGIDRASDEVVDALRKERTWKSSIAATAYRQKLQKAQIQLEQIDKSLRDISMFF